MSIAYKKHLIDHRVYSRPVGGWSAEAMVYREHGSFGTDSVFPALGTFDSREEAIEAAIALGKKMVDEGYDDSKAV
jgi:hypothetical protein